MCAQRRLSTRGMEAVPRKRALLDVDTTGPEVDDSIRRDMCYNGTKIRRIIQPPFLSVYPIFRPILNHQIILDPAMNTINPFPLAKIAYMSCYSKEKNSFDTMGTPNVGVKNCCYLLKEGSSETMKYAIVNNHLECFKHGHKKGFGLPHWSCYSALAHGSVDILKYTHENGCDFSIDLAFKEAAINGNLPCFEYIHKVGGLLSIEVVNAIIIHGNLDCLKYALRKGFDWNYSMCALSAVSGDLDFVKFCQNNGCPWVITDPSDWYVLAANLGFHWQSKDKASVDLVKSMLKCARYIETSAEVEDQCKLKNYEGLKLWSINL